MARPKDHAAHLASAEEGLRVSVARLVRVARDAIADTRAALAAAGKLVGGGSIRSGQGRNTWAPLTPAQRARRAAKQRRALAAAWARLTPAQRAARIAKMKAGHAKRKRARGK